MILGAKILRRSYKSMLDPFREKYILRGMSGGLGPATYDIALDLGLNGIEKLIHPGSFLLAASIERFNMPVDVMGIVHDKSSLARRGVAVQNTIIDPGWRGWLTLELTNHGRFPVVLFHGMPIAQVVFHQVWGAEPYTGKYQDQEKGPQEAR